MDAGFGTNVKVERSTFDTGRAVWLFVRNSPSGPVKGVLHLDHTQALNLIAELEQFTKGEHNED